MNVKPEVWVTVRCVTCRDLLESLRVDEDLALNDWIALMIKTDHKHKEIEDGE